MKNIIFAILALIALLSSGCVTKQTHEATLQELDETRDSLSMAQKRIYEQNLQIESNKEQIAKSNHEIAALDYKKAELQKELVNTQFILKNIQMQLDESQAQLNTMRQIEAETKKRNEIYSRFIQKFKSMIDGGQLSVNIEHGRIVINLPENVLFASGSAVVNSDGKEALSQVANTLKEFDERSFQIEGHTDNVPIKSSRYPSNWELSTARALSVLHLMVQDGVKPQNVSAAGFGEFQPRAENSTKEGRKLNRRIEIIMLPNLNILSNELPKVVK